MRDPNFTQNRRLSHPQALPGCVIAGSAVAKTTGSFSVFLRVTNNNRGRNVSLFNRLVYDRNVKADRIGATLQPLDWIAS